MSEIDSDLQQNILGFFSTRHNIERILPIINRTHHISLRILEYFVVTFARINPVVFRYNDMVIDVYESYRKQLKMVSKNVFDPFRRGEKFHLQLDNGDIVVTTWGQLCFFKWILQYGILDYIEEHFDRIQIAMKHHLSAKENPAASVVEKMAKQRKDFVYTAVRCKSADGQVKYTVTFE